MTRVNANRGTGLKKGQRLHKTTALTPANKKFVQEYSTSNNGTQSALKAFPHLTVKGAGVKATRLLKNEIILNNIEHQKNKMELLATKAVNKIEDHIDSENEVVSSSTSRWVYEQVHGKAVQKNINLNASITYEDMLNNLQ